VADRLAGAAARPMIMIVVVWWNRNATGSPPV
jgi:hypothetical protein